MIHESGLTIIELELELELEPLLVGFISTDQWARPSNWQSPIPELDSRNSTGAAGIPAKM